MNKILAVFRILEKVAFVAMIFIAMFIAYGLSTCLSWSGLSNE